MVNDMADLRVRPRKRPEAVWGGRKPSSNPVVGSQALTRRTGLELPTNIPLETWQQIGLRIAAIADSSTWWIGDWLVYGQHKFSARYMGAIESTGLEYKTLRNYAWVARRFSLPRRRDTLSFQHHAAVVAF